MGATKTSQRVWRSLFYPWGFTEGRAKELSGGGADGYGGITASVLTRKGKEGTAVSLWGAGSVCGRPSGLWR